MRKYIEYFRNFTLKVSIEKSYENKPIILIGPQGTGKSTTAKALAEKLGVPLVETDMLMIDEKYENKCKNEIGVEIEIKEFLKKYRWDHDNTAGPRSIGKSEIIKIIEEYEESKKS